MALSRRLFLHHSLSIPLSFAFGNTLAIWNSSAATASYHPLLFQLDLSILAYHLYGQSVVWPFDPYYEDVNTSEARRRALMQQVWAWAEGENLSIPSELLPFGGFRGPGAIAGFAKNTGLDPILYSYDRLNPRLPCLNFLGERWAKYQSPSRLTKSIQSLWVAFRSSDNRALNLAASDVSLAQLPFTGEGGSDQLFCFEGGTGDKGEHNQPHSQSLMGFALVSHALDGSYSVHIAFRGSRSGKGSRSMRQAFSDHHAKGNPDWVTDLGYNRLASGPYRDLVTDTGAVHRGFAHSLNSILPQLYRCLIEIAEQKAGLVPKHITVTGHSLGGALAQHFVSSVLMGKDYGPEGRGTRMPQSLRSWPWKTIKLITFGAPRVGDDSWARRLTTAQLQSEFFDTRLGPRDKNALALTDPSIEQRLWDASRPVGLRVLISNDPLTSKKPAGGEHVGQSIYVNEDAATLRRMFSPPDFGAHELVSIRQYLTAHLSVDPDIKRETWTYLSREAVTPGEDIQQKGTVAAYENKIQSLIKLYDTDNIPFDSAVFLRNADLFLGFVHRLS